MREGCRGWGGGWDPSRIEVDSWLLCFEIESYSVVGRTQMGSSERITARFVNIQREVQELVDSSRLGVADTLPSYYIIQFENASPQSEFQPYELAQSLCFCAKYLSLPTTGDLQIHQSEGHYYLSNPGQIRNLLNEYRSVIQNKKDSTHYLKIHQLCRRKLRSSSTDGLRISIISERGEDLTPALLDLLSQKVTAIGKVLSSSEFNYIYDGILQHSNHAYTDRYIAEFLSGDLNYTFARHAMICSYVKTELELHFKLLQVWNQLSPGPL